MPTSPSTFVFLFLAAAVALGHALQLNNGMLRPDALAFLTVAGGLALAAPLVSGVRRLERPAAAVLPFVFLAGLYAQIGQLLTSFPAMYLRYGREDLATFYWLISAFAVIGAGMAFASGRARHVLIAALVVAHLALGAWLIAHSPSPQIDVDVFHRDGAAALLAGDNPYAITFPNIYGHPGFYGPGIVVGDRVMAGYPYPPFSLLLTTLARLLSGGEHRWAQLVLMELAAVAMAYVRPGRAGPWAAAIFLTTPRFLFVLEAGWTEPFLIAGAASVVFAAYRAPRALPWVFGVFLGLKQYTVLAIPASWPLAGPSATGRDLGRLWAKALLVVVAGILPFFLWSPAAFLHSVVEWQFRQPFRGDALSYLAWWATPGSPPPSVLWGFVAAGLAAAYALWRAPRSAAGFAVVLTLTLFAFVAFNKQAFANYYYLIVGLLCVAAAAAGSNAEPITAESAPRALAPAPAKV